MGFLGYAKWQNFEAAVKEAMVSAEGTKIPVQHHFASVSKTIETGKGARTVSDYKLTRYACYLIAQNGDPRKEEIAFAQSYFALQTRKQELIEERATLFGGYATAEKKRRLGVKGQKSLADCLPSVTLAAKQLATEMTSHNAQTKDLQGERPISDEHVQNNRGVRTILGQRGIRPEELSPEEDVRKLERRVKGDTRVLEKDAQGFRAVEG